MADKKPLPPKVAQKVDYSTLVVSDKLFDGIKYVDFKQRFEELGIEELYKRGVKKDELIKKAIVALSEIKAKLERGEESIDEEEVDAKKKEALLKQAKEEEAKQQKEAEQLKQSLIEQQDKEAEVEKSYVELLKNVDIQTLEKAKVQTKANMKDAVQTTLVQLKLKYEAIEEEIKSRQ